MLGKNQTEDSPSKNFHSNKGHNYTWPGGQSHLSVEARLIGEAVKGKKKGNLTGVTN